MKIQKAIRLTAENYVEQQAILGRFPEAIWLPATINSDKMFFYLPETKYNEAKEFINEYRRLEEKKNE